MRAKYLSACVCCRRRRAEDGQVRLPFASALLLSTALALPVFAQRRPGHDQACKQD